MQEKPTTTLCIFVKPPTAGRVKTRLVPSVTPAQAAELAAAFFADTLALARSCDWARIVVACDGDPAVLALDPDVEVWPQGGGDLGERMERVLGRALGDSPAAIAVGTDSPGLPRRFLDAARLHLTVHDAVLGPCDDGGFYLLGLRRCPEGLLRELPWSVATTRAETATRLRAMGLSVAEIAPWFDVDVPADLARLAELLREERIFAPRTARLLAGATGHGRPA
jgi:rSAM/selenodomain-associated transferase 1